MSLKVQLLECETCKTAIYAFPVLPSAYVFPTGELARMRSTLGWCGECRHVRQVEQLPSGATLDKEEADLRDLARTKPEGLDKYEQKDLERIGLYRRLLAVRKSANRCMSCGSTNIDLWAFDEKDKATYNPHGGCAGRFRQIEDQDGMRIAPEDDAEAFSVEGEHLGRLSEQPGHMGREHCEATPLKSHRTHDGVIHDRELHSALAPRGSRADL